MFIKQMPPYIKFKIFSPSQKPYISKCNSECLNILHKSSHIISMYEIDLLKNRKQILQTISELYFNVHSREVLARLCRIYRILYTSHFINHQFSIKQNILDLY